MLVLDGDLGLGVGSQPREAAVISGILHSPVELVGELEGEREELGSLISSIAKHDTLVTGTELLESFLVMEALSNIGRLLLDGNEHIAGLVVEALVGAGGAVSGTEELDSRRRPLELTRRSQCP